MKLSKRTEGLYIRVCPEFLEVVEMQRRNNSVADYIHKAVAEYAMKYYPPFPLEKLDLLHAMADLDTNKRRKQIARMHKKADKKKLNEMIK